MSNPKAKKKAFKGNQSYNKNVYTRKDTCR